MKSGFNYQEYVKWVKAIGETEKEFRNWLEQFLIRQAYRVLAKKYHPDANLGDKEAEAKFKEESEAYAVLSDPDKKKVYDQFGHAAFDPNNAAGVASGFGGFDFNSMDF